MEIAFALRHVVQGLLILLAGIAIVLIAAQDSMVFLPTSVSTFPPSVGAQHQSLVVEAPDGVRLNVWWIEGGGDGPVVIGFGGNGERLEWQAMRMAWLLPRVRGIAVYDYRGYGESSGEPSEPGFHADAKAVYDWVVREKGAITSGILLWGYSLGGAVAADLALNRDVGGLVLESTFTSIAAAGAAWLKCPEILVDAFCHHEFDTAEKLREREIEVPVLLVHGLRDVVIPPDHSRELARIIGDRAHLELHDGKHWNTDPSFLDETLPELVAGLLARMQNAGDGS